MGKQDESSADAMRWLRPAPAPSAAPLGSRAKSMLDFFFHPPPPGASALLPVYLYGAPA